MRTGLVFLAGTIVVPLTIIWTINIVCAVADFVSRNELGWGIPFMVGGGLIAVGFYNWMGWL